MKITDVQTHLLTGPCTLDPFLSQARRVRSAAFIERDAFDIGQPDASFTGGAPATAHIGTYVEEVTTPGPAAPEWRFK